MAGKNMNRPDGTGKKIILLPILDHNHLPWLKDYYLEEGTI